MQVRTFAEWVVRPRLLTIPGVSQVIPMGGGRKQFQVLVDPVRLASQNVTLLDVEQAMGEANLNATGGYLERGSMEYLVRGLGRIKTKEDLALSVIKTSNERPVLLRDVAEIEERPQLKRGDSSVNGHPAVVLTDWQAAHGRHAAADRRNHADLRKSARVTPRRHRTGH